MMKSKTWEIHSNGTDYVVSVEKHSFSGKHRIFLNGEQQYYRTNFSQKLIGLQQWMDIPGKNVYVVFRGNNISCAVDGYYLDNNKEFKLISKVPKWSWIFIIACLAIPVSTLGGAVPTVIGVFGAMGSTKASVATNEGSVNFGLALGVTAVTWIIFRLFASFILSIM